jgi:hypothetical protein
MPVARSRKGNPATGVENDGSPIIPHKPPAAGTFEPVDALVRSPPPVSEAWLGHGRRMNIEGERSRSCNKRNQQELATYCRSHFLSAGRCVDLVLSDRMPEPARCGPGYAFRWAGMVVAMVAAVCLSPCQEDRASPC